MMPQTQQHHTGDVVAGPWVERPGSEQPEQSEVFDAEVVDEVPSPSSPATGRRQWDRVLEAGRTAYGQMRQLAESEATQARVERLRDELALLADGRRKRAQDPDEEFLRQFHVDGDLAMPVLSERFGEYKWAKDRIDRRREAEARRRAEQSDLDKGVEFAQNNAGALTGTGGTGLALADAFGMGAVPNWLSVPAALAAGAVGLYQTRELRKAGREYRHELLRKAKLASQGGEVLVGEDNQPVLPIAQADHEEAALDLTRRALLANDLHTRPVVAAPQPFGWRVVVDLVGGSKKTPSDVVKVATKLEVDLGLPENGILVQPHRESRARVTIWVVERDPFADVPAPVTYEPGSRSVLEPIYVGKRLDGALVSLPIPSTHGIVLAPSGGGKSILIRALVDGLAAANDVIQWDLDPTGRGQAAQAAVFRRRALTPDDCEKALAKAVKIAQARTALNLADDWPASAEHPAHVIWVDEFPHLTNVGKDWAIELLRIGRKAGVWLIFAAQDPKGDTIGADVAGELGFQAGGPGLNDWRTRMLFGDLAASEGWTPGRYKPKLNESDPRDAGTFYLKGTAVTEGNRPDLPMPTRAVLLSKADAKARAERYAEAGLVGWDADTLARLGQKAEDLDGATAPEAAVAAAAEADQRRAAAELTSEERAVLLALGDVLLEREADEIGAGELVTLAVPMLATERGESVGVGGTRAVVSAALRKVEVSKEERREGGNRRAYYSAVAICEAAEELAIEEAA